MGEMALIKLTNKKLAANRANAKKSTGPKTPEGKKRSAANAITHGLCTKDITALGEDYKAYPELRNALLHDWQPRTNQEAQLIARLAQLQVRLNRCIREETGLLDMKIPDVTKEHTRETCNSAVATAFIEYEKNFMNISRYEASLARQYDQTLKQLLAVRKEFRELHNETDPLPIENKEVKEPKDAQYRYDLDPKGTPADSATRRTGKFVPFPKPTPPVWTLIEVDNDGNERIVE